MVGNAARPDDISQLPRDLPRSHDQSVDLRDAGREAGAVPGRADWLTTACSGVSQPSFQQRAFTVRSLVSSSSPWRACANLPRR